MASNNLPSLAAAVALFVGIPTGLLAQGTDEQREACTPDAFRLCSTSMPDAGRVENCLRAAGPRLSSACHAVFYPAPSPDQMQVTRGQASERPPMSARAQMSAPPMQQQPMQAPPRRDDDDE